ncbi:MAG TPA: choice-of-anchor Q domain-containing protein, partial [Solirubrobacteraceae bacterium]|nr:choice-of-anchor Q domain-containing protein [Solirubrobacteraceae bacterium]
VEIAGNTFGGPTAAEGDTGEAVGGGAEISLLPTQPLTLTANTFENDRIVGNAATHERDGAGLFLGLAFERTAYPVTQSQNVFSHDTIEATQKNPTPPLAAGGAGEWIDGLAVTSTADRFLEDRVAVGEGDPPEGGALGASASAPVGSTPAQAAAFTGRDDLFSENSTAAGGWGGAIYVGGPPASCTGSCPGSSVTLLDSTVVGNSVDAGPGSEGGAIWGSPNDSLTVANSIVYGNAPQPETFGFAATPPSFAFSDVCNESGGPSVTGAGDICADPKLEASGAETPTSPTIDAGSNALVPAGLGTDIAGDPRILANRAGCSGPLPAAVDIGAFEFTALLGAEESCPPEVNCAAERVVAPAARAASACFVACADAASSTTKTAGTKAVSAAQPPCPPFGRLARPTIEIGAGHLRARHGTVAVRLTCIGFELRCHGSVTLSAAHAAPGGRASSARRHVRHRTLTLGTASFSMATGRPNTVEIHLSARARALLAKRHSLAVVIRAGARESKPGFQATAERPATLSRAGRRR